MADRFVSVFRRVGAIPERFLALLAGTPSHPLTGGSGMVREPAPAVGLSATGDVFLLDQPVAQSRAGSRSGVLERANRAAAPGCLRGAGSWMPRSIRIGAILAAVSLVLAGCAPGPSKAASHKTSASEPGKSPASTTVRSVPAARLIEPPGPISAHPALLDEASAACRRAGASDLTLCAGTVDAEVWGLPLVITSHLRDVVACLLKVNTLDNATSLAGPDSTVVADPNDDTLYSTAFLDLRAGPQLLSVPPISGRYVDFQLLDMYTNTIADVGVLTDGGHGGTYAFVGPGWHGTIPEGAVRIDVPTPDAWLLGRTQVKGPADLLAAVELEAQYSLTALSGHGSGTTGGPSTLACPAPALPSSTSPGFLGDLGKDMAADPPAADDGPVVQAMAAAGIGPGRTPGATGSGNAAEYLEALRVGASLLAGAAGAGPATIWTGYTRGAVAGSYGTDYLQRARLAQETPGVQVPAQAVYFSASRARSRTATTALVGTRSYEIQFPPGDLPPHGPDGFWSITLYNAAGFLVGNPIDRYSVGDQTPGLVRGADGSLTIVVSASHPTETNMNWLPAPKDAFSLVLRVYDPTPQVLDGSWPPPVIQAIS